MIRVRVNIPDLLNIQNRLANVPEAIELGMAEAAKTLRNLAIGNTPVDTGLLKRSWGEVAYQDGGVLFSNPQPYARMIEYGRYEGGGPRTTGEGFSRQAPEGMVTPILEDQAALEALVQLIADEIVRGIRNATA